MKFHWFKGRKSIERELLLKSIEKHRELNKQVDESIDKMIASLDGESTWFDCACTEHVAEKEKEKNGNGSRNSALISLTPINHSN